jgi:tetratricopeptide (TPR) repeat protein
MRLHRRLPTTIAHAALSALLLPSACTTSTGPAPSRIEKTPRGGFTITQDIHVGVGVRRDFDAALRLLQDEEYQEGIERLIGVTEALPQLVAAHLDLGIAYGRIGEFEKAEASLRRALELSPHHAAALNELGIALRHQGRFDEARQSYERALDVAPEFHFAHRNLAILCDLFLSDIPCAIEHYERYAAVAPEDEEVAIWIADLRNRAGR